MAQEAGKTERWGGKNRAQGREKQSIDSAAREENAAVLIRDGRAPLAYTDPHGTWLRWLG